MLTRSAGGHEHPLADFRAHLSGDLQISEEDTKEKLPSGKQTKYENRIYWAAIYLHRAGCLDRLRRGVFKITARGRQLLSDNPGKITVQVLNQFPEFKTFHSGRSEKPAVLAPAEGDGITAELDSFSFR